MIFFLILFNFITIYFFDYFSKKINIYDIPDKKRKKHKKKISLLGGLLIFISFLILYFFQLFGDSLIFLSLISKRDIISFLFFISASFLIGLYDDKYNLAPNTKLFLFFLNFLSLLLLNPNFIINSLYFDTFGYKILLYEFSILFTIFCLLLFVNSFNMYDGINCQSGFYSLIIFSYFIIQNIYQDFLLLILIPILFFLYLNYKNKSFLGNGGSYFISSFIGLIFIDAYNKNLINNVEQIFLIMAIPGLDTLRVAINRVIMGKHPFRPDNNHIHHLLLLRFNLFYTNLILALLVVFPLFLHFANLKIQYCLFVVTFTYFFILFKIKKSYFSIK
jgi:UDP-GlcNAc:undecaprenyl-phosphate GlcNAc-1-phosphate transferase